MKNTLAILLILFISANAFAQQTTAPQQYTSQPSALMMGSKAPDFNGVDYQGKKHSLKSLLKGHNAVVLFFYRGQWCQYCNKYLTKLQANLAKLTSKGAIVVAVTPETELAINTTASKTGASFPIINDKGYKIMKAYKVDYVVNNNDLTLMRKYHIDIDANNGNPATYVINKKEKIVFSHFDVDYRKRAAIDDIIAAIPAG
jgi:peroxiredoxin